MPTPDFRVETLQSPVRYSYAQIAAAAAIARALKRGRLVLAEPPAH
jgi:hypothetical protein